MRRCFEARRPEDKEKIVGWRWIDIRDPGEPELWRREDWELVRRMAG